MSNITFLCHSCGSYSTFNQHPHTHNRLKRDEIGSCFYINVIKLTLFCRNSIQEKDSFTIPNNSLNLSFDICFVVLNATRFVDFLCNNKPKKSIFQGLGIPYNMLLNGMYKCEVNQHDICIKTYVRQSLYTSTLTMRGKEIFL